MGSRLTPILGRQVAVGSLVATVLLCTVTWPVYENGFWHQRGLGTMGFWEYQYDAKISELDGIRGQPGDTLIHTEKGPVWEEWEDDCLDGLATGQGAKAPGQMGGRTFGHHEKEEN